MGFDHPALFSKTRMGIPKYTSFARGEQDPHFSSNPGKNRVTTRAKTDLLAGGATHCI